MSEQLAANLEFAKRFVAKPLIQDLLRYLSKDPANHIDQLIDLVRRLAVREEQRERMDQLKASIRDNPAVRQLAEDALGKTHASLLNRLMYNFFINSALFGVQRQRRLSETRGYNVPHFILVDPTSNCNLLCEGCWAGEYTKHHELPFERLDLLCREAKQLGIYWIVLSGGEPFLYPRLSELLAKHSDMAFMAYTNGTLINDEVADKILEVANISPAISLEGGREHTDARRGEGVYDQVLAAMRRLKDRQAVFGISLTATRHNVEEITSDRFIDEMIENGARYGWIFHYVPIGLNPNPDLMLTPEQREYMYHRVRSIRSTKPIFLADFWNDGEMTKGCIAGGRRYFHITASGDVEPCAFVHFHTHNINDCSLEDVLKSRLFSVFQSKQPFENDHLRPCPIIDVPQALRDIVAEAEAQPSHRGAEDVLSGALAKALDNRSQAWAHKVSCIRARANVAG